MGLSSGRSIARFVVEENDRRRKRKKKERIVGVGEDGRNAGGMVGEVMKELADVRETVWRGSCGANEGLEPSLMLEGEVWCWSRRS